MLLCGVAALALYVFVYFQVRPQWNWVSVGKSRNGEDDVMLCTYIHNRKNIIYENKLETNKMKINIPDNLFM
jgi:hypothetical protein